MASKISQNKPFANRPNSNSRIGPSYFNWCPVGYNDNSNACNNGSTNIGKKRRGVGLTGTIPVFDMSILSITENGISGTVTQGDFNAPILNVNIQTSGTLNPITVTDLTLSVSGTTYDTPLDFIYLYYSTNGIFSTSNLFGSYGPAMPSSVDIFTISGSQVLTEGNNYFWLAYDINSSAVCSSNIYAGGVCYDLTANLYSPPHLANITTLQQVSNFIGTPPYQREIICLPQMNYLSAATQLATVGCLNAGDTNTPIIQIKITTTGSTNPVYLTEFELSTNNVNSLVAPPTATIYTTGNDPNFSLSTSYGSGVFNEINKANVYGFQYLLEGDNYFWVTYDINNEIINCNQFINCSFNYVNINDTIYVLSLDPGNVCVTPSQPCMGLLSSNVDSITLSNTSNCYYTAYASSVDVPMLRLKLTTSGSTDPLHITNFNLLASGTTNLNTDLVGESVYYTYSADTWNGSANATLLGSFTAAFGPLPYPFNINTNQTLIEGDNYFWLTYSVDSAPNCGVDVMGGTVNSFVLTSTTINTVVSGISITNELTPPYIRPIVCDTPMTYVSSEYEQLSGSPVAIDDTAYTPILKIKVTTSGNTSPISIDELDFDSLSCISDNFVSQATVFYTGCDSNYNESNSFGTVYSAYGSLAIFGNQTLIEGDNYFWLSFKIDDGGGGCVNMVSSCSGNGTVSVNNTYINITAVNSFPSTLINSGYISINCMTYLSSGYYQLTGSTPVDVYSPVTKIKVTTSGDTSPIEVTVFQLNNTSTLSAAEIAAATIHYTGSDPNYSAVAQFGSPTYNPSGPYQVNGSQTLLEGDNYFWLSYYINTTACSSGGGYLNSTIGNIYISGPHIPAQLQLTSGVAVSCP